MLIVNLKWVFVVAISIYVSVTIILAMKFKVFRGGSLILFYKMRMIFSVHANMRVKYIIFMIWLLIIFYIGSWFALLGKNIL